MKLIIGLGNPGSTYTRTRHNAGFVVIDELAKRLHLSFQEKSSLEGHMTEGVIDDEPLILLKPQTFMNVSGRCVERLLHKKKIAPENILVVHDEADIPFGTVKIKMGGSSAGHNGMESILQLFPAGTAIARIRFGIGRPTHPDIPLDQFVLGKWTAQENEALPTHIEHALQLIHTWVHKNV